MSYHLFLDDERMPYNVNWVLLPVAEWIIVRNYQQFTTIIVERGVPSFVSFDHDLADFHYQAMMKECLNPSIAVDYGPEKTGYDCAKWLVDFCAERGIKFPEYTVHSMNPVGTKRIKDYIEWASRKGYI